jgi:uncharacterized damage-inducible protein DinB
MGRAGFGARRRRRLDAVGDQKPPRSTGDERETVLALLQYQRDSLVKKVSGVSEAAARRSPVASGTSLLWLVKHMTRAESLWILHRFAGREMDIGDDRVTAADRVPDAIAAYRQIWVRTDSVVAAAPDLGELCRDVGDESPVTLRWVLMHLLEETARHAGHADVLREMVDGETGR